MRALLFLYLIILMTACYDKPANTPASTARTLTDSELIALNKPPSNFPTHQELNRKQFYYTAVIPNDTSLTSNLYCNTTDNLTRIQLPEVPYYKIYLNSDQVIHFCDSVLTIYSDANTFENKNYKALKEAALKSKYQLTRFDKNALPEILLFSSPKIIEIKSKTYPKCALVKFYNTMCVKNRKDCDIVRSNGDTIHFVDHLELCSN